MARKALRLPAVLELMGCSRGTWYEGIKRGIYPEPTRLDPNGRIAIWFDDQIDEIQKRAVKRNAAVA
jgi:predicted DNA-binding transcriptional regulator AlpA